jgi:hypothetical protein
MKRPKISKKHRKEIEEMGDVVEIMKKTAMSERRDNEAEKLLSSIKEFPGSTQQELIIFLDMPEFEFRRAFRWLEHKGEIYEDDGDYVYPEFRIVKQ